MYHIVFYVSKIVCPQTSFAPYQPVEWPVLFMFCGQQLKKKLQLFDLKPCKIKTVEHGHFAFVTFR